MTSQIRQLNSDFKLLSHLETLNLQPQGSQSKGVYPQSDVSRAIVHIDASKGFVHLWVHLDLAILANFDVKQNIFYIKMLT